MQNLIIDWDTLFYRSFQQRLPYSTMSALASSLLDGTVFEIVQHLYEIQQMTERKLMEQRAQLVNTHKSKHLYPLSNSDV